MQRALPVLLSALVATTAHAASPDVDDPILNPRKGPFAIRLHAEVGFLATLKHDLQIGSEGDYLSVPGDLAQDILFPVLRFSADLDVGKRRRHTFTFLYQPLDLRSKPVLDEDTVVGDLTFPAGTALDFRYGFSFWRLSWMYDVLPRNDAEVALGLGLQIRNASIEYAPRDGGTLVSTRDIGPVPLLKFRGRGPVSGRFWMGGEIDGFWAPIRFLNGSGSDVEGAIADASLRLGYDLGRGVDTFLNIRYLGGGAVGTSSNPEAYTDGYTRNWLHFLTLSLGFSLR